MKLTFRVLWFEDDYEIVNDEIGPDIEEYLKTLGFKLEINHFENGDELDKLVEEDYDLILTDLNLGDHNTGDKLLENIRNNKVYTEVLMYSGNATGITSVIKGNGMVERVSFAVGIDNLFSKVKQVIDLTIKKVQDVNNIRGLVMAETSELDQKMLLIIEEYIKCSNVSDVENLKKYIFNMVQDSIKDNKKKTEKLIEKDLILNLINSSLFDSEKKRRTVNKIIKMLSIEKLLGEKCMEDYLKEVIKVRNILAHVKEEKNIDGKTVLKSNMQGNEIIFTEDLCVSIRRDLWKHIDNLIEINKYIEENIKQIEIV